MGRPKGSKNKPKIQDGTPSLNKTVTEAAATPNQKAAPKTTKKSTAPGRKPAQHSYKNTKALGY